ncbi:phage holin family protein [Sphingobium subterraneum]|uniref:Phage holin family protein n=1 Tax=Sphingobium subterraneum TaxID=627688 RepID=A0A841IYW1_9SPHN|nr:phage holin family protein [Sphingobium subterraneum]MBB6122466.1 hypothetical protein [Sphingobium subterraneum]
MTADPRISDADPVPESSGWSPERDMNVDAPPGQDGSIVALIRRAVAEGKIYASAEASRQKLRAAHYVRMAIRIAVLGIVALVLLIGALVALLVGLIVALAPVVGAGWATLLVIAGTFVVIAILGLIAKARVRALVASIASGKTAA